MAAKKKNAETVEVAAPSVIAVDARKLSLGLKMTFEGMAMVFDSLGVDSGVPTVKVEDVKAASPADKVTDKLSSVEEPVSEEHNTAPDAEVQNVAAEGEPCETETVDAADAPATEAQPDASAMKHIRKLRIYWRDVRLIRPSIPLSTVRMRPTIGLTQRFGRRQIRPSTLQWELTK